MLRKKNVGRQRRENFIVERYVKQNNAGSSRVFVVKEVCKSSGMYTCAILFCKYRKVTIVKAREDT